ncbi:Hypothetical protein Bdt_1669 [Bdellovibrio bacteriovorus str. Tiberius]|uniref:Uncharacterized protein n=1 Tax=Bdellovibrio bacteriovorus str. Tiberius TaxID=1069642 RepID=K7Z9W1_BDEBC|nr:Hypothetical protein Bdt_1669 [Bdellovibrio bacteriovorus str. Tiberius]
MIRYYIFYPPDYGMMTHKFIRVFIIIKKTSNFKISGSC